MNDFLNMILYTVTISAILYEIICFLDKRADVSSNNRLSPTPLKSSKFKKMCDRLKGACRLTRDGLIFVSESLWERLCCVRLWVVGLLDWEGLFYRIGMWLVLLVLFMMSIVIGVKNVVFYLASSIKKVFTFVSDREYRESKIFGVRLHMAESVPNSSIGFLMGELSFRELLGRYVKEKLVVFYFTIKYCIYIVMVEFSHWVRGVIGNTMYRFGKKPDVNIYVKEDIICLGYGRRDDGNTFRFYLTPSKVKDIAGHDTWTGYSAQFENNVNKFTFHFARLFPLQSMGLGIINVFNSKFDSFDNSGKGLWWKAYECLGIEFNGMEFDFKDGTNESVLFKDRKDLILRYQLTVDDVLFTAKGEFVCKEQGKRDVEELQKKIKLALTPGMEGLEDNILFNGSKGDSPIENDNIFKNPENHNRRNAKIIDSTGVEESVNYFTPNKECVISENKFDTTLLVDGIEITFKGEDSIEYFNSIFSQLGYKVSYKDNY